MSLRVERIVKMGTYDEYGYLGIQIKMNETGEMKRFMLGDTTPLSSGLYFSFEGVVVIDGFELIAVYPYEEMWDKWGNWLGQDLKEAMESRNPVKIAIDAAVLDGPPEYKIHSMSLDAGPDEILDTIAKTKAEVEADFNYTSVDVLEFLDLIDKTRKEVEAEMNQAKKPYWMVHRRGKQSGPATKVHHELDIAVTEAIRLARLEMDSFTILEAVMVVKPVLPVEVDIEPIDIGPMLGAAYPDALDPEPECGYGCTEDCASSYCAVHAGELYQPWPYVQSRSIPEVKCTCDPDSDEVGILCMAPDGEHCANPKPECTCEGPGEGCNICGGNDPFFEMYLPFEADEDLIDALTYSLANAFGIPEELIGLEVLKKAECPCGCDDYMLGPEHPFAHGLEEECEICAGIEGDLADFASDPPPMDCGYGCTDECVSSYCIIHAGELCQPEPEPETKGNYDESDPVEQILNIAEDVGMPQDEFDGFVETARTLVREQNALVDSVASAINNLFDEPTPDAANDCCH